MKCWRRPFSSRRRSSTRGARNSTVPAPRVGLRALRLAVAHHQGAPVLVALAAMAFDVIVGFGPKRLHQHPPRSHPRDLVQQQKLLTRFPIILLLDYLQHRWRPPSTRLPPGFRVAHAEGYAAFFMRASNPQLSVIARVLIHFVLSLRQS